MNSALLQKIEMMEASPALLTSEVDFDFNNPERVAQEMGHVFHYFGRVENEVSSYSEQLTTMLGTAREDGPTKEFIQNWRRHEVPHGQIFDQAQEQLGLEANQFVTEKVQPTIKIIGQLCLHSPALERVITTVYFSHGSRHEKLTDRGYRLMAKRLQGIGEIAFVETGIKPILRQEAMHLGYYQQALKEHVPTLTMRERKLAAFLERILYQPVGAKRREHRAQFGQVATTLGGAQIEALTDPVQEVSDRIFASHIPGYRNDYFVQNKISECVKEFVQASFKAQINETGTS